MEKTRTGERRLTLLDGWLEGWEKENKRIQEMMQSAIMRQDWGYIRMAARQNEANNEKKLTALKNIVDILIFEPLPAPQEEE